jgi:signal transduction histidine kinase
VTPRRPRLSLTEVLFSLRARLLLLVALAILPAVGLLVYTAAQQRALAASAAEANALRAARLIADKQSLLTENTRHVLQAIAELPAVRGGDASVCASHLAPLIVEQGRYVNAGLARPAGTLLCSVQPILRQGELSEWSFFRRALDSRAFSIGDYHWAFGANQSVLHFSIPVFDPLGSLHAILFVALDLGWLSKYQAKSELPAGTVLTLWDREGVILGRYPDPQDWLGRNTRDTPLFQHVAEPGVEGTAELIDSDGVERVYGYLPIRHTDRGVDAYVAIGIPTAVAYQDANRLLRRNLGILALISALAAAMVWLGADVFVLRQIRTLVTASRRLAGGEFGARTGLRHSHGEVGQLARSFDEMAASLEHLDQAHSRAEAELRRLNAELEHRVHVRTAELRKANSALKAINDELTNFAYVVSHDLKAPLRGIGSLADWLSSDYSDRLDGQGQEYLRLLQLRVRRLDGLIDGILQYSRIGRVREAIVPVPLQPLVEEVVDALHAPAHIRVTIENPLPTVQAEPTRMQQLFQNLIANAINYLDKPEGDIRIGCAADGEMWRFHVADNGPGIERSQFDKIFHLFQTLQPRDRVESTGVGLAIVKKIVELYGGHVWVESEPGAGSTFCFTLPMVNTTTTTEEVDDEIDRTPHSADRG